jgi:hypothetical protein
LGNIIESPFNKALSCDKFMPVSKAQVLKKVINLSSWLVTVSSLLLLYSLVVGGSAKSKIFS